MKCKDFVLIFSIYSIQGVAKVVGLFFFEAKKIIRSTMSLKIFKRIPKSKTFSFDNSDLSIFGHTVPRIIDQFGRKRCQKNIKMCTTNSFTSFFKNILLYTNCGMSKMHLLHTYVVKRFILAVSTVF